MHVTRTGSPGDYANLGRLFASLQGVVPLMGVCLGHQVVCSVLGGRVSTAGTRYMVGHAAFFHDGAGLLYGVPQGFMAAR